MERRGQVLIGFKCDAAFRKEVDAAAENCGVVVSQFVRDAVYEKLESLGFKIPASLKRAPSRAGKGGRKTTINNGIQQFGGSNNSASISNQPIHEPQHPKQRNPAKRKRKSRSAE